MDDRYWDRAVEAEIAELESAATHTRNNTLFECALKLYGLVKAGCGSQEDLTHRLSQAALSIGLSDLEVRRTIESAKRKATARTIQDRDMSSKWQGKSDRRLTRKPLIVSSRTRQEARKDVHAVYPPIDELKRFWRATARIGITLCDPDKIYIEASHFLAQKNIHAPALSDERSFGVLCKTPEEWPQWWPEYRSSFSVVLLAFDHAGQPRSVHGRSIVKDASPKTYWPAGFQSSGLLLASMAGVDLLRGKLIDARRMIICEGATDTLRIASKESGVPVLGIFRGALSAMDRITIPSSVARIDIATDNDEVGDEYARETAERLYRRTRAEIMRVRFYAAK